jgi:hypothetical protein
MTVVTSNEIHSNFVDPQQNQTQSVEARVENDVL